MLIVCAQSVALGEQAFASIGRVRVRPDRDIGPADVSQADALIIRSKTPVDAELIRDARLQFVGTATAGVDHLDTAALDAAGIAWAAAPGCNAESVAEYVAAALLYAARETGRPAAGLRLGIVGAGRIGARAARIARALGMEALFNDPIRAAAEPDAESWYPLDDLLSRCDIVSLHVPLTDDGPCPTRGMVDDRFFGALKPGALFMNTSRGEVVDEDALLRAMDRGAVAHAVLDVWQNEPTIRPDLLERALLGTPHIAGYSLDGRVRGTDMIYRSLCGLFECAPQWNMDRSLPPAGPPRTLHARALDREELCRRAVASVYDIREDHAALRGGPLDAASAARRFSERRAHYPERREFASAPVRVEPADDTLAECLRQIGFDVEQ